MIGRVRREPFVPPVEEEGYDGPALLVLGEERIEVEVHLLDHLEPLDGRTHFYGRIQAHPTVVDRKCSGTTTGRLVIGGEQADVRLAELDYWGNVTVSGVGRPPY